VFVMNVCVWELGMGMEVFVVIGNGTVYKVFVMGVYGMVVVFGDMFMKCLL